MSQEIMPTQFGTEQMSMALTQMKQLASVISKASGMIPAAFEGKENNIFLAMQYGASVGLNPIASLQNINVIKGKPSFSGQTYAGLVRLAGHTLRIERDEKNMRAKCTIIRKDDPNHPTVCVFSMADAERAGLTSNPSYRKYPMQMLTWRAVTDCARNACSELFLGVGGAYTSDELSDGVREDEVAAVEATVVDEDDADAWGASKTMLIERVDRIINECGFTKPKPHLRVYELLHEATVADPIADIPEEELRMWVEAGDEFLANRIQTLVQQAKERKATHEEPEPATQADTDKEPTQ